MQPYAQLRPTHPAYRLQGFRLGFPVTDKGVHYQGVDIDNCHLNGSKPGQFEAFTLDVDRLSPDQSTALIQLYREYPRLVAIESTTTDAEILSQIRFLARDVKRITSYRSHQIQTDS